MRDYFKLVMILVLLMSGCSSTHLVKPSEADYSLVNEHVDGETSDIYTREGKRLKGRNLIVYSDSLHCVDSRSNSALALQTRAIDRIIVTNNSRGALEGAAFGALAGLAGSAIMRNQDEKGDYSEPGPLYGLFVIGGAVWGLGIGALIGHTETLQFEQDTDISATD